MEKHVDDCNFKQEVLDSKLPVLVDFWAAWCGPCLALGPAISDIAKQYEGKIKVCKVNVDEAPQTAGTYCIQSIPTLAIFKNGEEVERVVGGLPKSHIEKMLKPFIG